MSNEEKPFQDREDVKLDIRQCSRVGTIIAICSLIFAVIGVIGDAVNITLGLESMSWFLLAIVVGILGINPFMKSAVARHLYGTVYGIETERKKEERPL